jgi:hypothetical protein
LENILAVGFDMIGFILLKLFDYVSYAGANKSFYNGHDTPNPAV